MRAAGARALAFALALVCTLSAGEAAADDIGEVAGFEVRVLLSEGKQPVRVSARGRKSVRVEPGAGSVLVDGKPVGKLWRSESPGLQVGGKSIRGAVEIRRTSAGLAVINRVPIEPYVAGTLGREIYSSWAPATLQAQAVVTRTYAMHRAETAQGYWHLTADTAGQVYGGASAENPAVVAATRATQGQWLSWKGEPILAAFHSASGGRTASAVEVWGQEVPYLVSVEVSNEEDSPDTYWRATVSNPTLGRALAPLGIDVGPIRDVQVGERSPSGRAQTVQVRGRGGQAQVSARELREALGMDVIRSTLFQVRKTDDGVVIVGSGHGHGVGMSQWGAQAMAKAGANYRQILTTFYPGTRLVNGAAR